MKEVSSKYYYLYKSDLFCIRIKNVIGLVCVWILLLL